MKSTQKLLYTLLLVFGVIISPVAQELTVDSLHKILKTTKSQVQKIGALNRLAAYYSHDQPQKGEDYALKALKIAQTLEDKKHEASVLITLGIININTYHLSQSRNYFRKALKIYKKIDDIEGVAKIFYNIGAAYYMENNYLQAMNNYLEAAKTAERLAKKDAVMSYYGNIGLLWQDLGNYAKAKEYLMKGWKYAQKHQKYRSMMQIGNSLADNYFKEKKLETALKYADTTLFYARKLNVNMGIGFAKISKARVYLAQNKYQMALEHIQEAQIIFKEIGLQREYAHVSLIESKIQLALEEKQIALQKIEEVKAIVIAMEDNSLLVQMYETLYHIYKQGNQSTKALEAHELYHQYQDLFVKEEKLKQVAEVQIRYETEKKEQKIRSLKQKNEIKDLQLRQSTFYLIILLVVLLLLALAVIIVYLFNYQKRLRLERKAQDIEQKLLRVQMSPHFIFNALNAINVYIQEADKDSASLYLIKFSKLMRQILEDSRTEYVSLEQEMNMLENYLSLQKLRQGQTFEYEIMIDDNIDIEEVAIPPMFAQPFVENAIEHGIAEIAREGKVQIHFSQKDNQIILSVQDNGVGIQQAIDIKEKKTSKHQSLATQITKERIELFRRRFKKNISFEIENLSQGTRIIFQLPYKYL